MAKLIEKKTLKLRRPRIGDAKKWFVKANKNMGICDVLFNGVRDEDCKRTLAFFQGRDIRLYLRDCLNYAKACKRGGEESEDFISTIHFQLSHPIYREEEEI